MKMVDINGFNYGIIQVEKTSIKDTIGTCNCETQIIEIKKGLSLLQRKRTLIHELTHAFLWCYGFMDWKFNEEAICNFIGTYAQQIVDLANEILSSFLEEENNLSEG